MREGVVQVWVGGIEEWRPELARALAPMPLSSRMVLLQGEGKRKKINMKSQDMESLLVYPLIMKLSITGADPAINED